MSKVTQKLKLTAPYGWTEVELVKSFKVLGLVPPCSPSSSPEFLLEINLYDKFEKIEIVAHVYNCTEIIAPSKILIYSPKYSRVLGLSVNLANELIIWITNPKQICYPGELYEFIILREPYPIQNGFEFQNTAMDSYGNSFYLYFKLKETF